MAAGTALQVFGAIKEGEAASAAGKYNAATARQNAQAARQEAAIEESQNRMLAFKTIGAARANFAASGLAQTGSIEDVLADSMSNAELDALLIRYRGEVSARGYNAQANMSEMGASAAKQGAYFGAATTLLRGSAATIMTANIRDNALEDIRLVRGR
jgi:hypothetical protein